MKTALAILTAFQLLASSAIAQPASSGPPPTFKIVQGTDKEKGRITLLETVMQIVPVQKEIAKERVVVENGMQVKVIVTEKVTEQVLVIEERITVIEAAKTRVITPDGKQLPIEEVWKRLKKDTVVAASADGNAPAPAYLRTLHSETLIIVCPPRERVVAPGGVGRLPPVKPSGEPIAPPKKSP